MSESAFFSISLFSLSFWISIWHSLALFKIEMQKSSEFQMLKKEKQRATKTPISNTESSVEHRDIVERHSRNQSDLSLFQHVVSVAVHVCKKNHFYFGWVHTVPYSICLRLFLFAKNNDRTNKREKKMMAKLNRWRRYQWWAYESLAIAISLSMFSKKWIFDSEHVPDCINFSVVVVVALICVACSASNGNYVHLQ